MRVNFAERIGVSILASILMSIAAPCAMAHSDQDHSKAYGAEFWKTREAPSGQSINRKNVGKLSVQWVWEAAGDLPAMPAIDRKSLYVGDGGGKFSRIDRSTGKTVWQVGIALLTGSDKQLSLSGPITRSIPALSNDLAVIGTRNGFAVAVSKESGALIWRTKLDEHPGAMVTGSPVIHDGVVYLGVSSTEAALAVDPAYPCCSFRGSAMALDLESGKVLWKTYTVPEGYSGGPIWGGPPVIDVARGRVIFGTGQNYTVPAAVGLCVRDPHAKASDCMAKDNDFDSVVAFDLKTGVKIWSFHGEPFDAWTLACGIPEFGFPALPQCDFPSSPDHDFGAGVNLFQIHDAQGHKTDVIGAGQKSGKYWLLRAEDGKQLWQTKVEGGGAGGGIMWGTSVANNRIFMGMANSIGKPLTLQDGTESKRGGWAALNADDGSVAWKVAAPVDKGRGVGPTTVVNDVMFAASFDPAGYFYAFDTRNGNILWKFPSGGSTISAPVILDNVVYWGSGYGAQGGTSNNKLYAFKIKK